ncbi:cytochrome c biogenesis protein CcdA [Paenibacillus sp. BR2-3]|uniref:cytochrome c biogenesis CcdA family protein n=1 Tax=Paenibacillus sp. BR2-3 TaxID=3048494 RepID=UPI0039778D19
MKPLVLWTAFLTVLFIAAFTLQQSSIVPAIAGSTFLLLLGLLIFAGVLDGFNPCAFSTLLLWSGFLINRFGTQLSEEATVAQKRRFIFGYVWVYSAGIFLTYLLLGFGLLSVRDLIHVHDISLVIQFFGFIVVILGVVMYMDSFRKFTAHWVKMPKFLYPVVKKYSEPTTKLAAFGSGVAIGLCSVPCSGAIYIAIILILQSHSIVERYTALLIYNVGFIAPVLIFALILTDKRLLQVLSKDFVKSREVIKRVVAIITIVLGLLSIYLHG